MQIDDLLNISYISTGAGMIIHKWLPIQNDSVYDHIHAFDFMDEVEIAFICLS